MVMLHSARQQAPVQGLARWLLGLGMAATLSANVAHGLGHVRALMTLAVRADASCFAATAYSTGSERRQPSLPTVMVTSLRLGGSVIPGTTRAASDISRSGGDRHCTLK